MRTEIADSLWRRLSESDVLKRPVLAYVGSVVFDAELSAVDWDAVFDADHLVVVILINDPVAAHYPEAPWFSYFVLSSDNAIS